MIVSLEEFHRHPEEMNISERAWVETLIVARHKAEAMERKRREVEERQ